MTKDQVRSTEEALRLALEALKQSKPQLYGLSAQIAHENAITAIKEALEQTEQDGKCKHCTDGCPACDARKLLKEAHDLL
jgi:transketolase